MLNFSKNHKLHLLLKATTAATSSTGVDGQVVDTAGFNCATFINVVADVTGADGLQTLTIKGSTASAGTYQALSGATVSTTTGQKDGLLAIEVDRPTFRYLKPVWANGPTNGCRGGIICILSDPKNAPVTHDSTSMLQSLVRVVYAAT